MSPERGWSQRARSARLYTLCALYTVRVVLGGAALVMMLDASALARCRPGEMRDVKGGCTAAPSLRDARRATRSGAEAKPRPKLKPVTGHASLAMLGTLGARHLVWDAPRHPGALAAKLQRATATLGTMKKGTPAHDEQVRVLASLHWERASALELRVLGKARTCLQRARPEVLRACLDGVRPALAARELAWREGLVFWRAQHKLWRARPAGQRPLGVGQLIFFEVGAHAALGDASRAALATRTLLQTEKQSAYTPLALATLGDMAFQRGEHMTALRMFHRASQAGGVIEPYALYMKGWCYAERAEPVAAMQHFIRAHASLQRQRGRMQSGGLFRSTLYQDMMTLYAAIGDPARSADFLVQLGMRSAQRRALLTMLADRYTQRGDRAAAKLARTLASAQTADAKVTPNTGLPFKVHRLKTTEERVSPE